MVRAAIAFAWTIWGATVAFAAGPYGSINIGTWTGGAYTNDRTGTFSHCAAASAFPNGVVLIFGQNTGRAWMLGFAHPGWGMKIGESFAIQVIFDGQAPVQLVVTADGEAM